jgi:O-6-methylguanine DNA methyltransferase
MKSFQQRVVEVVKQIPKGGVLTYGEVAKCAGNSKASRAVGTIMAKNIDKNIPCHRVVRSDGSLGMYNGLQGKSKQEILEREGVIFNKNSKVVI